MGLHAFVAMPCERRQGIDFAAIRDDLLAPALTLAGLDLLPADDIRADYALGADTIYKRLLADLVVIDLSSDDAQAQRASGLYHAVLAHTIVFVRGEHDTSIPGKSSQHEDDDAPLLIYRLKDGRPDPAFLAADRAALASLARTLVQPVRPNRYRAGALSVVPHAAAGWTGHAPIRQLVLFSGHMIDTPNCSEPRFPAEMVPVAAAAIATRLDELAIGRHDLALCGGACGGDLLFAEAALRRGCPVQLHLQFPEAAFLRASVAFAGEDWVDRYYAVRHHPLSRLRVQPDALGPPAAGMNPYLRNNLWQLYTALASGADALHFLVLWDGQQSANPGGTQNMVDSIRCHNGRVSLLDTRKLFRPSPAAPQAISATADHALP